MACNDTMTAGGGALLDGAPDANPYTSVRFHFGMLLGVDDFETEQAYARGKTRLHNAWLHREGVVWGLNVAFNARRELQVSAGLALDAAGRELHLDGPVCVDLGRWYDKHKDDAPFAGAFTVAADGVVTFGARVVIRFRACLGRQVPAMTDPCDGGHVDTAYSRVNEAVEVSLVPLPKAADARAPYHRLRLLFGLETPDASTDDQAVAAQRAALLALPIAGRAAAALEVFRDLAALDAVDLKTAALDGGQSTLFPADDDTAIALCDLRGIKVQPATTQPFVTGDPLPNATDGSLDITVRPTHVATRTIQELLCGQWGGLGDGGGGAKALADAGGPRLTGDPKLAADRKTITFKVDGALSGAELPHGSFSVTTFEVPHTWNRSELKRAAYDQATATVTLELRKKAEGVVRLIVRGTGGTPLLGAAPTFIPFAGRVGGAPTTRHDGADVSFIFAAEEP